METVIGLFAPALEWFLKIISFLDHYVQLLKPFQAEWIIILGKLPLWVIFVLAIILMASFHRWRGSDNQAWIGRTLGTFVVMGLVAYSDCDPWFIIFAGLYYHLGSIIFGWGKWIGIIIKEGTKWAGPDYDNLEGKGTGTYELAEALVPERKSYYWNAAAGLFFTGMYWWTAVVVSFNTDLIIKFLATIGLSIAFPASVMLSSFLTRNKVEELTGVEIGKLRWEYGEIFYGAMQGFVLSCLLIK